MYWSCLVTLLGVTPYIVSSLPLIWGAIWRHCTRIAHHLGCSADIVPELPRAVRRQCLWSAPGSAETLYGVPPKNVPGQPETLLGVTRDNAEVASFVWPAWIDNHSFHSRSNAFLFLTEWRNEWDLFKLEWSNTTCSARLPTSTPLGLLRHRLSVTLT